MRMRIKLVLLKSKRALPIQIVHLATRNELVAAMRRASRSPLATSARSLAIMLLAARNGRRTRNIRNTDQKLRFSRYSNTNAGLALTLALVRAPEPVPKSLRPGTLALTLTRTRQTRVVRPRPYYRTDRTDQGHQSIHNTWHSSPFITCHTSTHRNRYIC